MGWKSPTLAGKMSPDLPDWLKKSISKKLADETRAEAVAHDDNVKKQAAEELRQQKAEELETSVNGLVGVWATLEIDQILEDVKSLLDGNSLSQAVVVFRLSGTYDFEIALPQTKTDGHVYKEYGQEKGSYDTLLGAINAGVATHNLNEVGLKMSRSVQVEKSGTTKDPGWGSSESFTYLHDLFSIKLGPKEVVIGTSKPWPIDKVKSSNDLRSLVDNYLAGEEPPYKLPPEWRAPDHSQ